MGHRLITYPLPWQARVEPCRSCGAPMVWTKTAKGKTMCLDLRHVHADPPEDIEVTHPGARRWEAEPHWGYCPQAKEWGKKG